MNDATHHPLERIKYVQSDHIDHIHEHNIDLAGNELYLFGEDHYQYGVAAAETDEPGVEYTMANRFIRNLRILSRKSDKPILVHMKTCGGHWAEGMAIHNTIKACPNQITILNYTHARSMSSLILQAADKRVMMPDSYFMFHQGTMGQEGTVKQYFTEATELQKTSDRMLDVYVEAIQAGSHEMAEWTVRRIKNWLTRQMDLKEEVYFSAEQAVEIGFADEVFGHNGVYDWVALTEYED